MSTDTAKRPVESPTDNDGDDDKFVHRFCKCSEKSALCGKTKDDWKIIETWNPWEECIVCEHLHTARKCPKCLGQP